MKTDPINQYIHHPLDEEVTAIGGHYVVNKEIRLSLKEGDIFYTVGYGIMDTTCCGTGGCSYATVYGRIKEWKGCLNEDGLFVTRIEPIRDDQLRKSLHEKIMEREIVQQVNFMS